jgi:CheY-like chemotaxis protein
MASRSEQEEAADLSPPNDQIDLKGCHVLVVEDEPLVAMLLVDMLEAIGCEIAAVASRFEDALEKARCLPLDLAILDVHLEGVKTFQIAELLSKRAIGFVFATGYSEAHPPADLANAAVLRKPFAEHDVVRAMRQALQSVRRTS